MVKNLPVSAGDARDAGLIPGSGRSSDIPASWGYSSPLLSVGCTYNFLYTEQKVGNEEFYSGEILKASLSQVTNVTNKSDKSC